MADSTNLSPSLRNITAETSVAVSRNTSHPTLKGIDTTSSAHHYPHPHQEHAHPVSPKQPFARGRANSSVSRVDVAFFDPAGVQDLRQTLTHQNDGVTADQQLNSEKRSSSSGTTLNEEPFDFEKVLRNVVQRYVLLKARLVLLADFNIRRDEAHIKPRSLGVAFRNLQVVGTGSADTYLPTLGSVFNPAVILEGLQNQRHPKLKNILQGFEGVVRPGQMLRE